MSEHLLVEAGNKTRESERAFRPGWPIRQDVWEKFLSSRNWDEAPMVFGGTNAGASIDGGTVAEDDGKMTRSRGKHHAYFGVTIESGARSFADEVDKNSLLRFLAGEAGRWQVPVTDFVLTDDRLCLVVCKDEKKDQDPATQRWYEYALLQFAVSLKNRYADYYGEKKSLTGSYLMEQTINPFADPAAAMAECVRIHALPVEDGYVDDIKKYWFSGYITLRGRFAWNFMDPSGLMRDLGRKPATALKRFETAHRAYMNRYKQIELKARCGQS